MIIIPEQTGNCCPVVLPEVFSGEGDFSHWIRHFESVAVVNGWEEDSVKLQWLHACYWKSSRGTHVSESRDLSARERFDPPSKRELYKAQLQCRG